MRVRSFFFICAAVAILTACVGATVEPATTTSSTTARAAAPTTTVPVRSTIPATAPSAATTSSSTTSTLPARQRLVVHGTGDVNVDPDYIAAFRIEGYGYAWSGLDGLFVEDDLTVINLECPVSDLGTPAAKTFTFRCDPAALGPMRQAGIDVANLANNHSQDFGIDAMLDSIDRLGAAGIAPIGVGADVTAANAPALFEIGGWTVAVVGFGGVVPTPTWFATHDRPGMSDGDDIDSMVTAVQAADELADIVIVTIHWGVELDTEPRPEDIARAEAMIDAGADAIFGHHSHRLNPLGFYQGRPIAWGLGNFVWPRLSVAGATTAIARVTIEPDGTIGACLIPTEIVASGHPQPTTNTCTPTHDQIPGNITEQP
jgi:hypothetical protein